tara:strand:+ start:14177 stop:14401 length:225 start_codon:yes stop_codon:yes gene_type:complete
MTVTLTLQRVNPDTSVTNLSVLSTNSSVLFPAVFTLTDYPPQLGVSEYRLVATSADSDRLLYYNINMSGLFVRR